ncbi:TIGR00266 family protein [Persephonella sp.]|uniref:TIGR00266 family protein n=1 Tax=Persephonella sp. TaxID=2060922 RepID=UPI0025FEEC5E|nr:TIGR00266 family protein [Persephonella sp.]
MEYGVSFKDSFSMLHFKLDKGESVIAGSGAMVYMDPGIKVEPFLKGGLFSSITRKLFGKESAFLNKYKSFVDSSELGIVSNTSLGSISETVLSLDSYPIKVRPGGFLAAWEDSEGSVEIEGSVGGFRTYFGMEGFEFLKIRGTGLVFISGFGGIYRKDLGGNELIVDTGHVLAYTENLDFELKAVGGVKSTLFSGEGVVCKFRGVGSVWIQSRSYSGFFEFLRKSLFGEKK